MGDWVGRVVGGIGGDGVIRGIGVGLGEMGF
jgi:hypothetical protein